MPSSRKKKKQREEEAVDSTPDERKTRSTRKKKRTASDLTDSSSKKSKTKAPTPKSKKSPKNVSEEMEVSEVSKPSPSMDVVVHRIRHLQYHPKPILCMQATPPSVKDAYIAISRDNGSVEVKAVNQKFRTIATVAGYRDKQVNALAWIQCEGDAEISNPMPILVGGSQDGTLFIVHFSTGKVVGVTSSGGGGVFALASLCQRKDCGKESCSPIVAAGCEDGSVRLYQVDRLEQKLEIVSTIPSTGAAVLSLAWRNGSKLDGASEVDCIGSVLFAGVADGTIRRYDCLKNAASDGSFSWKAAIRMTVESYGRNIPTRVWALEALSDGTVVSADSLGHVQFWDGTTGTLQQSFVQSDDKADVLALDATYDENKVFASGVDSRVICIERQTLDATYNIEPRKWIMTHAQRPHTHDVKAVVICRQHQTSKLSDDGHREIATEILCTGGVDTKLCIYQVNGFQKKRPRTLYPWPSISPISMAARARILVISREDRVDLYRLGPTPSETVSAPILVPEEKTLLGTIEVQSLSNLVCATISNDGRFLALADAASLMLFKLDFEDKSGRLKPSRVPVEAPEKSLISAMQFIADHLLLVSTTDSLIHIISLPRDGNNSEMTSGTGGTTIGQTIKVSSGESKAESSLFVHSICTSKDSKWFAAVRNGLHGGLIDVYRDSGIGSFGHWWTLPQMEVAHTAVAFLDGDAPQLAVTCLNFAVYVFDLEERRLCKWSEKAGYPVSGTLPAEISNRNDFPVRLAFDPASPSKILMGSFGTFISIDMSNDFPKHCQCFPKKHVRGKKQRKRAMSISDQSLDHAHKPSEVSSCTLCLRYNSMLFLEFIDEHEMVVVEQPWLSVVTTFPDALQRKIYGS